MAEHDVGVRRSATQRLGVTSAAACMKIMEGDRQVAEEHLQSNPSLADARVDAARKTATKRAQEETFLKQSFGRVKDEHHKRARVQSLSTIAIERQRLEAALAYDVIVDEALVPHDYPSLSRELKMWADRKYDKVLWGSDFKANSRGYLARFSQARTEAEVRTAAATMRSNLIAVIRRYHSHVAPKLQNS
eukprot:SAG31_NODE_14338_length_812_cov_4.483871_1_plen_190_part_00